MTRNFKFALIGSSLKHSLSPKIHNKYANIKNINCTYDLINVENLAHFINNQAFNYDGFNVTFPYKIEILKYLDVVTPQVLKVGSCNCVKVVDGKLIGYNTDYDGFKFYFDHVFVKQKFSKVLVFGYGGAAKAITSVLEDLKLDFTVANRTLSKVPYKNKMSLVQANEQINNFDLIINTTSVGYNNDNILTNSQLKMNQTLIDLNYKPEITPFLNFGKTLNLQIRNGLDMLIIQALVAFDLWTNTNYLLSDYIQTKLSLQNKIMVVDGFMGSGKSTFVSYLSSQAYDLDKWIEENEKMSIPQIFQTHGEKYFRKLELKYFEMLIAKSCNIIALGGGFSYYNKQYLKFLGKKILIVYIDTNFEQIKNNVQASNRPLKDSIVELFTIRKSNYEELANIVLTYKHNQLELMVQQLIKEL